jgi:predicted GNAT family acetyltransferase
MRVVRYDDVDGFASAAMEFLLRDEARNNFFVGVVAQLARPTQAVLATVEDAGDVVAVAVMTPRRHLCLTENAPAAAVDALVQTLLHQAVAVPGVQSSPEQAERFAKLWEQRAKMKRREGLELALYRLDRVAWPVKVNGALRQANEKDIDLAGRWIDAFSIDLGEPPGDGAALAINVVDQHRLHFWEVDGTPVSMAAWARPTANGCAINFVYTPRELRGNGYASNAVAALSQKMLDVGKRFCTLYTDLANPTSNSIYQKIGYRFVSNSRQIFFDIADGGRT